MFIGLLNILGLGDIEPDGAQERQRSQQHPRVIEEVRTPNTVEPDPVDLYNSLMMLTGVQFSHPHGLVIFGGEPDIVFHSETG